MEKYRKASPERLSGGQKQRIAIAGVLALKPEILVLDESTAMLDPKGRKEVLAVAEKLNKEQGTTVIAITHYMEETVNSDRIIVLSNGEIVLDGSPEEIFKEKEKIAQLGLELPYAAVIADGLTKAGVSIKDGIITEEGLVEALCESLQKI